MATYKDLRDRIQLDYLNRYDLQDAVKRAIANTIRCHEGHRWWFNETATSTACTVGQSYLGVPSDFLVLDLLELNHGGTRIKLRQEDFDTIRRMNATSATSLPTHFCYRGDRFELALQPDSAYTATCHYIHSLPALSADTDSNAWTNEASNLIAHGATLELLTSTISTPDDRKIRHHENMFRMALTEMYTRNDTRLQGRLEPTQF